MGGRLEYSVHSTPYSVLSTTNILQLSFADWVIVGRWGDKPPQPRAPCDRNTECLVSCTLSEVQGTCTNVSCMLPNSPAQETPIANRQSPIAQVLQVLSKLFPRFLGFSLPCLRNELNTHPQYACTNSLMRYVAVFLVPCLLESASTNTIAIVLWLEDSKLRLVSQFGSPVWESCPWKHQ